MLRAAAAALRSSCLPISSLCRVALTAGAAATERLQCFSTLNGSVLVVQPRRKSEAQKQESRRLAKTYAGNRTSICEVGGNRKLALSSATYFKQGVVELIERQIQENHTDQIVVDATLTGVQLRNLEQRWGVPVLDRVGLIIEIFSQRARSREARLQVELAALDYRGSRLVRTMDAATGQRTAFGSGDEVVSARERGRSGGTSGGLGGGGGAGETELQLQRRRLMHRRKALQMKIVEVQRTREVQRAARQRSGKPVVAIVGYTNAGKSSLIEALTGQDVGSEDKLFATLDTTMRSVFLPSGSAAILTDTVGFISDLPPQLLSAFKGTLEEAAHADLLLHVVDASSPQAADQHDTVIQVLRSLGVTETQLSTRMITVHNKVDLLDGEHGSDIQADKGAEFIEGADQQQLGQPFHREQGAGVNRRPADHLDQVKGFPHTHSAATAAAERASEYEPAELYDLEEAVAPRAELGQLRFGKPRQHEHSVVGFPKLELHPPIQVSALTAHGLQELLEEIDRKVSFKTGMNLLAHVARVGGRRVLTQNVVGPYRPPPRQQQWKPPVQVQSRDRPWQATWSPPTTHSLAQRVFLGDLYRST